MAFIRWTVLIVAVVLIVVYGTMAHQAAAAAEGGALPPEAFQNAVWAVVTYFVASLIFKFRK